MLTNLKKKTVYHPSESLEDPLLIRDDNTLEILDESSIQGFNSLRHPHQLADPSQETINWSTIYDNYITTSSSVTIPTMSSSNPRQEETCKIVNSSSTPEFQHQNNSISGEHYHPTPQSSDETSRDILPQNNNSPESTEIVQNFTIHSSNSSELSSIIDLDSIEN
ncbi:hypothetical protein K3495_g17100, partial [Podosphaera aphanis]